MTTRAKCKLCNSIIEPTENQIIVCNCGEITLEGFSKAVICAKDILNYCEVDDMGNEIVEIKEKPTSETKKPTKSELLNMLDDMIKGIERLPTTGMLSPVDHYGFASALLLLSSILRADDAR